MGCTTATGGSPTGGPRILDRTAGGVLHAETRAGGTAAFGPPRPESLLSGPAPWPTTTPAPETSQGQPEVKLHELWFLLPAGEQQRFGHRFSSLVLKALGQGSRLGSEVES
jgi:hypothetical protein